MKKSTKLLLALASAFLLAPAYYRWGSGFLMFFALIPLLMVEDEHYRRRKELKSTAILLYLIPAFMLFVLLTVWWVRYAAGVALLASLIVNTSFLVLPFYLFHYTRRLTNDRLGYLSLIVYWIAFEYLFLNVQVNFPWILFGNAFANDIKFIQWYDVTGSLGGSLWILLMNILIYSLYKGLKQDFSFARNKSRISAFLAFLLIPMIISLVRYYTYEEDENPYEFLVLQPNIDPNLKFVEMPQEEQTAILLDLAEEGVSSSTEYVVGPETFINNQVWQHLLSQHSEIEKLYAFVEEHPKVKFVIGAMTYKRYSPVDSISETAKPLGKSGYFYDSYNTALQLDSSREIQMYHKSKLVTGAEWMPTFKRFKFIEKMSVNLGGITRSHGMQKERDVLVSPEDGLKIAPVICWESVFGEYVTEYVKDKGAEILVIITNDGWWRDTPGHRQHNSYAHLRAIETRRSVARSANTGISSLINQKGEEIDRLGWWKAGYIKGDLNANDHLTFYTKHGNYIARISAFVAVILFLYAFVNKRLGRNNLEE